MANFEIPKDSAEVIQVLNDLNIPFEIISEEKTVWLLEQFFYKYVENAEKYAKNYPYPVWDFFKQEGFASFQYEFAWDFYDKILANQEVLLFFEPTEDLQMIYLKDGGVMTKVLNNCFGMVTYITNPSLSFLFCYNDHDFLIVGGEGLDLMKNANVSLEEIEKHKNI